MSRVFLPGAFSPGVTGRWALQLEHSTVPRSASPGTSRKADPHSPVHSLLQPMALETVQAGVLKPKNARGWCGSLLVLSALQRNSRDPPKMEFSNHTLSHNSLIILVFLIWEFLGLRGTQDNSISLANYCVDRELFIC